MHVRSKLATLLLFIVCPVAALADQAADEAIRTIVSDQVVAWNAGDGRRYAKHLAPDASFTNLFGMVMYGAPAFEQRHIEILSTFIRARRRRMRFDVFASSHPTSRSSTSTTKFTA